MEISKNKQKFIIESIFNEFDLKCTKTIETIDELYNYYGLENIEDFFIFISKNNSIKLDGFFIKNKFKGPEYKRYKLMSTVIAMSSEWAGYSSILMLCAYELVKEMEVNDFDYVIGLTQGGVPLSIAVSSITDKPFILTRVKSKTHYNVPNMITLIEPNDELTEYFLCCEENKKIILVDDEITSGKTLQSFVDSLSAHNIEVAEILVGYNVRISNYDQKEFDWKDILKPPVKILIEKNI